MQGISHRLILATRAILSGWATLFLAGLIERAILTYGYRLAPTSWWQTAGMCLDLLVFTGAGWIAGRLDRPHAALTVTLFCFSLLPFDIDPLNVPFTFKLLIECFSNARYLSGLFISLVTNAVYLGCVSVGGTLGRGAVPPTTLGALQERKLKP